jgi:phenylalanyl-tRNA synthetase beta chain
MSNSLTKAAYYDKLDTWKAENSVKILNPLSNELNVMRQTLLFGGLEAIVRNINRKNTDLKFYETGNCYTYKATQSPNPLNAYKEDTRIALFLTGNNRSSSWNHVAEPSNFFTLKALIERLMQRFGVNILNLKAAENEEVPKDIFADGISLSIPKGKHVVTFGPVARTILKTMDIEQDVFFAEISLQSLLSFARQDKTIYKELARFPEVRRDLALIVDKDITFSTLRDLAFRTERKLLKNVGLFDIYEGDKLPVGKKQYALSFIIQDDETTLTDKTIEQVVNHLIATFDREIGAVLR